MKRSTNFKTTFPHSGVSLWQSIVAAKAREHIESMGDQSPYTHFLEHPMVKAAAIHGQALHESKRLIQSSCEPGVYFEDPIQLASLSLHAHIYADSLPKGHVPSQDEILQNIPIRCYSTKDRYFIGLCAAIYAYYKTEYGITAFYQDWQKQTPPLNNLNFGVIQKKLPRNAKVGIIGDWATGLNDTKELLKGMLRKNLDAVIHLGDIYYAGTPDIVHDGRSYPGECTVNFKNIFKKAYQEIGMEFQTLGQVFNPPPVFNLAGNHDYYCMGKGFFELLPVMPETLRYDPAYLQQASYFQLMLEGDEWQFLAMDTGRNDYSVVNVVNPDVTGPKLEASEVLWHQDKMERFPGKTILLSHHQLFSANTTINGSTSEAQTYFVNSHLYSYFSPYFQDKIHAWFWGHEHNLVGFQNGQFGLSRGRLVGNGGYQSNDSFDHPDQVNYPQIRVNTDFEVKRDADQYLYHAACILDFGNKDAAGNPCAQYFQMPSWGRDKNPPLGASFEHMSNIDEYLSAFQFNMLPYLPAGIQNSATIRLNVYAREFWHNVGSSNQVRISSNSFDFSSPFEEDQLALNIQVTGEQAVVNINCNYYHYFLGKWIFNTGNVPCDYQFGFTQVDDHLPFSNPEISYVKYTATDGSGLELLQYQAPAVSNVTGIGDWNPSVVFKITYQGNIYWIAVENM